MHCNGEIDENRKPGQSLEPAHETHVQAELAAPKTDQSGNRQLCQSVDFRKGAQNPSKMGPRRKGVQPERNEEAGQEINQNKKSDPSGRIFVMSLNSKPSAAQFHRYDPQSPSLRHQVRLLQQLKRIHAAGPAHALFAKVRGVFRHRPGRSY